ncbi:DMT family transporter [Roseateles sp. BYS180W]|uniref:DMT family transporter n=1 Tax=Roseateles rivi TaxID=3299028 RepID=A0ABW7FXL3_9BURK
MSASWMMVLASALFASMGVCVKLAAAHYSAAEIVMYRGLIGAVLTALLCLRQGLSLRTAVPGMHLWRSISGVSALCLWFYAIAELPLATAMTFNYMSSVWMAAFLLGGSVLLGAARLDGRLVAAVLVGFVGVGLLLRPTLAPEQIWHALAGLTSGVLSALAYLQVGALGRAGEPELRVVFFFSVGGAVAGALLTSTLPEAGGWHGHSLRGAALLLAVGLLATAAQLLMTRAYAVGKALTNATLNYLGIVFSVLWGVLIFDERLPWMSLLGMLLIVAAGFSATLLRTRAAGPKPPPDMTAPKDS